MKNEKGAVTAPKEIQRKDINKFLKFKKLPVSKSSNVSFWIELLKDGVISLDDLSNRQLNELIDFSFFEDYVHIERTDMLLPYVIFRGDRYHKKSDAVICYNFYGYDE